MDQSESTRPHKTMDGRVTVITGAGTGLGMHYSKHLATLGAHVAVVDRDVESAREVAEEIKADGGVAEAFMIDVGEEESVRSGFAAIHGKLGQTQILVNNAGNVLVPLMAVEEFTLEQWNIVIGVNLTGAWLCSREVIPAMKEAGWGRIINISSATLSMGSPENMVPYIASKGGVVGFTRAMARELGAYDITVNGIAPGFVHQVKKKKIMMTKEEIERARENVMAGQAIKRPFRPGDLLGALEYFASDGSAMTTGQVMTVDGGWAFN